ncbi:MAG: DNA translocase FtsK [Oscillospiraceae bacterium]|nr:DNA translocase FtsK [Oscillospiraceae bacterium]
MLPVILAALSELMLNTSIHEGAPFGQMVNDLFDLGKVMKSGGVIGGLIAYGMFRALSMAGTLPLLILGFLYCFIVCCWGSVRGLVARITRSHNIYVQDQIKRSEELKKQPPKPVNTNRKPPKIIQSDRRGGYNVDIPLGEEDDLFDTDKAAKALKTGIRRTSGSGRRQPQIIHESSVDEQLTPPPTVNGKISDARAEAAQVAAVQQQAFGAAAGTGAPVQPSENAASAVPVKRGPGRPKGSGKTVREEAASPDEVRKEREKIEQAVAGTSEPDDYVFPPLSLLRASSGMTADATDEVTLNRVRLEEAIRSFGISASVVGVIRGPTVTRYDLELDRGVKLSRITNLAGDLALSLGVVNVRIAPIPDKISTVGIEVPNRTVSTVFLGDILNSSNFSGARSKLSFSLGKDIGGNCIVGNISKLPHLLIAGTTGSGKSVCMNSLILSLLYKARPDEVKLIMIDPKMVELGIYNGIPHLYVPVVTDPKKAAGALQWAVVEMMKRYQAFSEIGVRDLDSYNHIQKEQQEETKPRVVIVIDELADLMLVASKEVEESICRIAQMGRAAGMHLVIATQRPSADVITGLMKANIPSRIAFAVSSAMESRIILDQGGAEKLIGFGDMLYSPLGAGKPVRIQGSYVSDEEREEVIRFIKENNSVETAGGGRNSEIEDYMIKATKDKNSSEEKENSSDGPVGDYDEMLPQAVDVVLEMGSCSVSMLQRRLKLGYSRAARIVDQMEELGVVGPYEGAKPRGVAIDRAGWQELQVRLGYLSQDSMGAQPGFDSDLYSDENDSDF